MSNRFDRRHLLTHGLCLAAGAGLAWLGTRPALWSGNAAAADGEESHEERLRKLRLELPRLARSKATLVPAVRAGDMLYVSGHIPNRDGKPIVGKVGRDLTVKEAQDAARNVGLGILSVVRKEMGSLDRVVRLVRTFGMVNCTSDFTEQSSVINAFSNLMVDVFGETAGKGARCAVGMVSLPLGVPVEVECSFQVKA